MNSTLKTKLTNLEARNTVSRQLTWHAIFICPLTADDEEPPPVDGFGWDGGRVWRAPGETDDQLRERAVAGARMSMKPGVRASFIGQLFREDQK